MSAKIENSTADLLNSVRNHVNALADEKVIDPLRIRYAIGDRRVLAEQFHSQGLSNRASADILGVDERTVRRDLAGAANAAPNNEPTIESEVPAAANAALDKAFGTMFVLARAAILMMDERRSGSYDDDSWVCDMWMCGRHLRDNANTFARLLPNESTVAIWALKMELSFSELEKEIIKNWRPKALSDKIAMGPILEKIGEMDDVEFWTPLKEYFPEVAALCGPAP